MPSPLDLCQVADVRAWLGMKSTQTAVVSTTIALAIVAGVRIVTPLSMANISVGSILSIDVGGNREYVTVAAVSSTTFTATFALSHSALPVRVNDETDTILSRVITAASVQWLRVTGSLDPGGATLEASPFAEVVNYDERYDGNNGTRLFVRHIPIANVDLLTVSGASIPVGTGDVGDGFIIYQSRTSIGLRSATGRYQFTRGIQNVHLLYSAGYESTPEDVEDAVIDMVALNYRRRNWIDQVQDSKSDSIGTVKYRDWELSPKIVTAIEYYSRQAPV